MGVPCCALVCLLVGLGGLVLHTVAISFPYWFVSGDWPGRGSSSFGMWEVQRCPTDSCNSTKVDFGVAGEFEATRVFACATLVAGLVACLFNVALVMRPTRVWAIRTVVLWLTTAIFCLMGVILFAVFVRRFAQLLLPEVALLDADVARYMGWAYWLSVAGLVLLTLVTLGVAVFACHGTRDPDKQALLYHRNGGYHAGKGSFLGSRRDSGPLGATARWVEPPVIVPAPVNSNPVRFIDPIRPSQVTLNGIGDRGPSTFDSNVTSIPLNQTATTPRVQLNSTTVNVQHPRSTGSGFTSVPLNFNTTLPPARTATPMPSSQFLSTAAAYPASHTLPAARSPLHHHHHTAYQPQPSSTNKVKVHVSSPRPQVVAPVHRPRSTTPSPVYPYQTQTTSAPAVAGSANGYTNHLRVPSRASSRSSSLLPEDPYATVLPRGSRLLNDSPTVTMLVANPARASGANYPPTYLSSSASSFR